MKKKRQKKFDLNKETIRSLDSLGGVVGGQLSWWNCDPESRGFTNCTYCNGETKWHTDCTEI